jgi:VIT1/CCC1 family predicted Fe2+/Mn2+ transporter
MSGAPERKNLPKELRRRNGRSEALQNVRYLRSNLSLVMGVAGASINRHGIVITGVAGLIAGAFSVALGEWVSVTSARELAEREIRIESSELEEDPKGEGEELQLIYESKGLSLSEAKRVADQVLSDKTATLDALARGAGN